MTSFEKKVRLHIYDSFVHSGRAPTVAETAEALASPLPETQAAFRQLSERCIIMLQDGSDAILRAAPFWAVPTTFRVEMGNRSWWGSCIWDALGIPAMLKEDARIVTACGCCDTSMTLTVRDGRLAPAVGAIHFVVPTRHWYDNIVFT